MMAASYSEKGQLSGPRAANIANPVRLAQSNTDAISLESRSFLPGNGGKGFVVVAEGEDFVITPLSDVALLEEHFVTGAFAILEFFLFGVESILGEKTGLAGGIDLLELAAGEFYGRIDLDHDGLLQLFVSGQRLFLGGQA